MICSTKGHKDSPLPCRQWLFHPVLQKSISYCGMNTHFQNGLAECKIRDMQEHTLTALLYPCNKWLSTITVHLWPYAMQHLTMSPIALPRSGPTYHLLNCSWAPQWPPNYATFILSVVLHMSLTMPCRLDKECKNGIKSLPWHLTWPITNHAYSVAFVLNPKMGHVSPQFHIKFNDFLRQSHETKLPMSKKYHGGTSVGSSRACTQREREPQSYPF